MKVAFTFPATNPTITLLIMLVPSLLFPLGKTTVSRLLFRFYDVLAGSVRINGEDVRSLKQTSLRGTIGVVPQNACLFNDTLKNNIKYGRHNATDEEFGRFVEEWSA